MTEQLLLLFLASIFIGGFIGGSTNMIAIKMLFRPWKPLYIGNVKLPLTPGVIPAKKRQLANKIANVVANSIITPQAVMRAFEKTNIKQKLAHKIIELFETIGANQSTLAQTLQKLGIDHLTLQNKIINTISESVNEQQIKTFIKSQISIVESNIIDKPINQILPASASKYINDKLPEIAYTLQDNIASQIEDPVTLLSIITSVQTAINIRNPIIKTIINSIVQEKQVQKQLIEKLQLILLSPSTNQQIVTMLENNIEQLTAMSLQDIYDKNPKQYDLVKNNIIHTLTATFNSWINEDANNPLHAMANQLLTNFWQTPVSKIHNQLSVHLPTIVNWMLELIMIQLDNNLDQWLELFSIHSLVEDQVNSFPAADLEILILKVAKRELSYITYFGVLLGSLLGLIQFTITIFYVL